MTHQLDSLLGDAKDVACRKQLTNVASYVVWLNIWLRRALTSLQLHLRLFAQLVMPDTRGSKKAELDRIDTYDRRHLGQIT